ncbi:MAG: toll/interleukin-1 receptor domain-containing protein [Actinophytocola sp.]|uniref:toll/interleukin-1 receptor domain-containing protein n=1 Tax=Actinophytocola sp. TaxID=1872138 RepID=UPI003C78E6B3
MTDRGNKVSIGGDVAGNFVIGDHNSIGPSSEGRAADKAAVPRLFVSYRIDDSVYAAAAIADQLTKVFGAENVFRDRDALALGELYPKKIRRALERCDIVLAVVGPSWLDVRDSAGQRRLDDPDDWVRTELRMAFDRDIPVVPVLLDGTPLPDFGQLPADITALTLSTCWQVRHQSFESDVRGLIDRLTAP